jgi:hypothetical protein
MRGTGATGHRIIDGIGATEMIPSSSPRRAMTFVPARRERAVPATGPASSMRMTARQRPARSTRPSCARRRVAVIWRTSGSGSYVKRGWNVTGDAFVVDDEVTSGTGAR